VEYALIILLVAVVVVAGLSGFGSALLSYYNQIATTLPF